MIGKETTAYSDGAPGRPGRWGRTLTNSFDVAMGDVAMRASLFCLVSTAFCLAVAPVLAADAPKDVKGLYLLTDYPALSVRPGTTASIALRLQNYGLSPERYQLSVADVPAGWTATLLGGGQPGGAAGAAARSDGPAPPAAAVL